MTHAITRVSSSLNKFVLKGANRYCLAPCVTSPIQVANLTAYGGNPPKREKPWPYKEKGFRYWHIPFDLAARRFNENTKIIVIEGNLATGKTELGQKLAKEFDMLYVPDIRNAEMCDTIPAKGIDLREYDEQLPVKARTCDFEKFYSKKGSKKELENFPRIQYELYRQKVYRYAHNILAHVLNTGQGVVMSRGMWSDMVFAHTLTRQGYMRPAALKAYMFQYTNSTVYFCRPHLVIYLDAPVSTIKDRIKKRNVPWEVNSPVLTDDFLHTVGDVYKTQYLPSMKKNSLILNYNVKEMPDFEAIVEDMERLDLDDAPFENDKLFEDWRNLANGDWNHYRNLCSVQRSNKIAEIFDFHPHQKYDAPELFLDQGDAEAFREIVLSDPKCLYSKEIIKNGQLAVY
ncbi:NADH dehydrogenase [ubiquinone] 1 alpha subcomplex subunit 10, mitochondrial-like [Physella acuta]|uniref:NADH dehydrogenase [ubiquinone] 1 alpha subcomplex subunit 10, mitochondrial-like n=1 Tax=Physella acuta TaxID=109671 RepID=UPI0027DD2001|nr:NADH dehydrogenase [ubiquinone] 1 alpha subcomplex subunit 10, mitochondrial-like [Physella acuta]